LEKADVHLHYANNKGRGSDNVTITIVDKGEARPYYTSGYKKYIEQFLVSGWHGSVNVPKSVIDEYGPVVNGA